MQEATSYCWCATITILVYKLYIKYPAPTHMQEAISYYLVCHDFDLEAARQLQVCICIHAYTRIVVPACAFVNVCDFDGEGAW